MAHAASGAVEAPDDDTRAAEQKELDARLAAQRAADARRSLPALRLRPGRRRRSLALFTSQFVHAGWLHLAGNMWFLVFCGMNLEDRWGRVVFPLFYLASGAAAGAHARASSTRTTPRPSSARRAPSPAAWAPSR